MQANSTPRRFVRGRWLQILVLVVVVCGAVLGMVDALRYARTSSCTESVEWPAYGRDPGGSRYSPLAQIDPTNVKYLEPAWVYRTGDWSDGSDGRSKTAFQATPLVVDGVLYVSTIYGRVIALDPDSGGEQWTFDPQVDRSVRRAEIGNRGVATWFDPATGQRRIFVATIDARLVALDAASGRPCADFGAEGTVDLSRDVDLGEHKVSRRNYGVTSPPAVLGDLVIVGSAIGDNRAATLERGGVRAFDVRSGQQRWLFDPIPRDPSDPAWASWEDDSAVRTGAGNVWAQISVDPQRDLVFVPTSSPSPDYYGGQRRGSNRYGNSVVALRGTTGKVVWDFQVVHHDLWDYDVPAQPTLVTVRKDGREIPAVAQATKMGFLFLLDRETGQPIFPVEERRVPVSDVPGEQSWATQPFPTAPPPLAPSALVPDDAWGITPWDRNRARELIGRYRYDGIFTPPSLEGSIQYPGIAGGTNWGSVAFEPDRGLVVLNMSHVPFVVQLIRRDEFGDDKSARPGVEYGRQLGTPYVVSRWPLLSPLGLPCSPPPWGTLLAVELSTGNVKWQVPLGTIRDLAPVPLPIRLGVPGMGGPIVTGGQLVFIGAAADNYLRAFDVDTGDELWKRRLPAGGQATPMTYCLAESGKQYVVIAAGGHGKLGTKIGDHLVAFALRSRGTVVVLWLAETLLALAMVFVAAGYVFLAPAIENPTAPRRQRWARSASRALGTALWLAAIGLVLPSLLGDHTWSTPMAAAALAAMLLGAALTQLVRRQFRPLLVVGPLFAVASCVAYLTMGELLWVGVSPW